MPPTGKENWKLGILTGGGPAPGINAVIAAACIRARLDGVEVLGIHDGFAGLMAGDANVTEPLEIADVSRIHTLGGSKIGMGRANPTRDPADLARVSEGLRSHGITHLITIGGDDTAYSAYRLSEHSCGALKVAHVPKTIDNDLDLPPEIDTFGYKTARSVGVGIVQNLMVDAKTTGRWYFVIAMGRKAGHLALGIGKAAGATLTIIPEEFEGRAVSLDTVVQTLAGAILKRRADNRNDGVAVIAEGVTYAIREEDLSAIGELETDEHGHPRLAEFDLGYVLKQRVRSTLAELGIDATIVEKNIGYELRSAEPVPSDLEYCRDLGYCAAKYLLDGGGGVMISMQGGCFVPVPLGNLLDPATGRMQVRMVDIHSTRYAIARRYMIRLRRDDFEDTEKVEALAASCGLTPNAFRARFEAIVKTEPPPLEFEDNQSF